MRPAADSPILQLAGVTKEYGAGSARFRALDSIDLTVMRGEFFAIVGASGSGKTTLLNLIGCLDQPTAGRYMLDGTDVSKLTDDELSRVRNRSIGFIFQSFHLIPELTVLENVEVPLFYGKVPRRERHGRCRELLDAVGMSHRSKYYPAKLSGGERQRTAVARAMVNEPALLLADEPTGNLDSTNGEEVMALFHELHRQGRTIAVVTHNPEISGALPREVELRDGRIVRQRGARAS